MVQLCSGLNMSVEYHEMEYKHTCIPAVCGSVQTVSEVHSLLSELKDASFLHSPHSQVSEG